MKLRRWPSRSTSIATTPPIGASEINLSNEDVIGHALAVDRKDDVVWLDAGAGGRSLSHAHDDDALGGGGAELFRDAGREWGHFEVADRSAADLAVLPQFIDDAAHEIAWHRKADPLISAALRENSGIDADELAAAVDQRAS